MDGEPFTKPGTGEAVINKYQSRQLGLANPPLLVPRRSGSASRLRKTLALPQNISPSCKNTTMPYNLMHDNAHRITNIHKAMAGLLV